MNRRTKQSASGEFLKVFGPGVQYRKYEEADEARLAGRIPRVMQEILQKEGWCSYNNQVLWICDPDDWQSAARAWFPAAANAQVFLRTGFGDLFVWDGELFWYALAHESIAMGTVDDPDWFFSRTLTSKQLVLQGHLPAQMRIAQARVGPLQWNEMYSYVPALALGGDVTTSRIEKVKALEALGMLAELAPIQRRN
jgi:hypothetical protein